MAFLEGEIAILNNKAKTGLPMRVGEKVKIELTKDNFYSPNFQYVVAFDDNITAPVREIELNKLTEDDKMLMEWLYSGNTALHKFSGDKAKIIKCDYILKQVEVEFLNDGANTVVDFDSLEEIEDEVETEVEKETYIHEELLNSFLGHYKNNDNTYTLPKELLINMLKQMFIETE